LNDQKRDFSPYNTKKHLEAPKHSKPAAQASSQQEQKNKRENPKKGAELS
jgi:hypothetical protein